jgi:hypothetical protein
LLRRPLTAAGRRAKLIRMQVRDFAPGERERVEKYLQLDVDLLYTLIPPYVHDAWYTHDGQQEAGRKWFAAVRGRLEQTLCAEWQVCRLLDDPRFQDRATLVVILGDAIAVHVGGLPPVLVASIIVKMGVRDFCACP